MLTLKNIIGIVLVIIGVVSLYGGFDYTTQDQVAKLGDLKVTVAQEKTMQLPPIAGGLCLVLGVVLIAVGRFKK